MAKFWEQDWFQDALPYAAGALALGALGYGSGVFGGGGGDSFFGAPSGDFTSGVDAAASGAEPALPMAPLDTGSLGGSGGAVAERVLGPGGQGMGDIFSKAPAPVQSSGFQTGIPVLDNILGAAQRNPALALGALGLGASMIGNSTSPQRQQSGPTAEQLRSQDMARWNAIPVQAAPNRRALMPVGSPGSREQRYFENYASGGALRGPGDAMSDDIPAVAHSQDGSQRPINVADGEYIIPGDVVSGLGNGSTDAGVRQLDAMLRRVRQARHGTGKQPPAIDPNAVMPA